MKLTRREFYALEILERMINKQSQPQYFTEVAVQKIYKLADKMIKFSIKSRKENTNIESVRTAFFNALDDIGLVIKRDEVKELYDSCIEKTLD